MIIGLRDLDFKYPKAPRAAISGLTATISPGMHLLLGENGAGKTTLLHLIAGLIFPSAGDCCIDDCPAKLRLPSINSHMFLTGTGLEFPARSIKEMARTHAPFFPNFSPLQLVKNMKAFGLDEEAKLSSLSTGNYQKAKVAYALALNVDILLLDEPANGLDIESKRVMQQLIAQQISPEQTVIISTHTVADLEHLYDGVIDLKKGKLQYSLTVDNIIRRIRFVTSANKPDDAIYTEQRIGLYHSILQNETEEYTDPDYQLLYMAMRQPGSAQILYSILNYER